MLIFVSSSVVAAPTVHISDQLLRGKTDCANDLIDTVGRTLLSLRAPEAVVYLGAYNELEELLVKAGTSRELAMKSANAVANIHDSNLGSTAIKYTAAVFDELVANDKIMVCAISKECSLAQVPANYMLFTERHEGILLTPPPISDAQHFALNLFSSVGTSTGERILMNWLRAEFTKEKRSPGSASHLYRQFASQYDGTFPPNSSSIDQGFAVVFMTLFQMLVAENIYAFHHPGYAVINRTEMAGRVYVDLMFGRNKDLTAEVMQSLGMTETNLFIKSTELLETTLGRIKDAGFDPLSMSRFTPFLNPNR